LADSYEPIYKDWEYAKGQIWCKSMDSNIDTSGGIDCVSIGESPLWHSHPSTMAETLTGSLSRNFGGGSLVDNFTIGSKEVLTQDTGYGPASPSIVTPPQPSIPESGELTYPLWGQNILDWRNPRQEHNNVPPSLNIYVRYCKSQARDIPSKPLTYAEATQ
jgi:hypothetical protein